MGTVTAVHTPGHTPACMTYVCGSDAFVGDTLFMPDGGTAFTSASELTVTTDASGEFHFTGLYPGSYTLEEIMQLLVAIADDGLTRRADGKIHLMRVTADFGELGTIAVRIALQRIRHRRAQIDALAHAIAVAVVGGVGRTGIAEVGNAVTVCVDDACAARVERETPIRVGIHEVLLVRAREVELHREVVRDIASRVAACALRWRVDLGAVRGTDRTGLAALTRGQGNREGEENQGSKSMGFHVAS